MKMEPRVSSETSAIRTQTPGNYPKRNKLHIDKLSSVTSQNLLKMEPIQCSETSVFDTQTPGKYPEDNLSLLQHGESLKSKITYYFLGMDPAACIYLNHEFNVGKRKYIIIIVIITAVISNYHWFEISGQRVGRGKVRILDNKYFKLHYRIFIRIAECRVASRRVVIEYKSSL